MISFFSTFYYYFICYSIIGDKKMKKIVRSIFIPIIIAILFGLISGRFVYRTYKDNLYNNLTSSRVYLLENGIYDSVENMREENSTNNYIYYKDNDKYKTVIGITNNYNNIDKIKKLYNDNISIEEYYIGSNNLDSVLLLRDKLFTNIHFTKTCIKQALTRINQNKVINII